MEMNAVPNGRLTIVTFYWCVSGFTAVKKKNHEKKTTDLGTWFGLTKVKGVHGCSN